MAGKTNHFVLVHGFCHGAWCWYKLVPLLKSLSHRVTALDLSGCGVDPKRVDQIPSYSDYIQPLMEFMESLPHHEKVVLIGHSFGAIAISLAMESFPEKILLAIYLAAVVPNTETSPAALIQEFLKRTPREALMDWKFNFDNGPENPPTSGIFGPNYLEVKLYQCCQTEDLELAKMMVKPSGLFLEDLSKESLLTEENFGAVRRVLLLGEKDGALEEDFHSWIIENGKIKEFELILGADHMVMLSNPQELCQCLLKFVETQS